VVLVVLVVLVVPHTSLQRSGLARA
jgi:hypothetical protein